MVVEPVVGHGAQFSCVVLDTPRGPVALPPTEVAAYDLEHDVLEAHLDMERRQARFEVRRDRNMAQVWGPSAVAPVLHIVAPAQRGEGA